MSNPKFMACMLPRVSAIYGLPQDLSAFFTETNESVAFLLPSHGSEAGMTYEAGMTEINATTHWGNTTQCVFCN